jgi:single-strand DNA-binding protein
MYLNKVMLIGNLTRDPELKSLPSGTQVVNFGMATNRTYKDKNGEKKEVAEFHNVVAFGRLAEVISQYMKKGRQMYVEGRLQTRSWDDKETGKKNYRTEIIIENFQFGSGGGAGGPATPAAQGGAGNKRENADAIEYPDEPEINPDDIPF